MKERNRPSTRARCLLILDGSPDLKYIYAVHDLNLKIIALHARATVVYKNVGRETVLSVSRTHCFAGAAAAFFFLSLETLRTSVVTFPNAPAAGLTLSLIHI